MSFVFVCCLFVRVKKKQGSVCFFLCLVVCLISVCFSFVFAYVFECRL